jgi:CRISPR system Cascade subunit CasC
MFIELHIIQNFAPSNLNRSDTGSPKDCEFGGVRRARVSSQCFKRAMRDYFKADPLFATAHKDKLATRTKRLLETVVATLREKGRDETEARRVVENALNGVKLTIKENDKTQYLLFLGQQEIAAIADSCERYFTDLLGVALPEAQGQGEQTRARRGSARDTKRVGKDAVPEEIRDAFEKALNGGKAADLALFGRMLADLPQKSIDAAAQVAHAISTHKTGVEFDFYTAVDDIRPEDTEGADMLGTVEFNSACFYRYANIDIGQLQKNLDNDAELTRATIEAFIRSAIAAIPTGKQNSMAAQNPPSFVLAVVRESELWSLANAFVKPVRSTTEHDVVETSIRRLDEYWKQLTTAYGDEHIREKAYINLSGEDLPNLNGARVDGVKKLIETISAAVTCS